MWNVSKVFGHVLVHSGANPEVQAVALASDSRLQTSVIITNENIREMRS